MNRRGRRMLLPAAVLALAVTGWFDPYGDAVDRGNSAYNEKKYDEALEAYDRAGEYAPAEKDRDELAFNRGAAEYRRGDYGKAADHFRQATRSPDPAVRAKAWFNLGNSYLKQDRRGDAAGAWMQSLQADPDYLPAKKNLEYLLREQKKREQDSDRPQQGNDGEKNNRDQPGTQEQQDTSGKDDNRSRPGEEQEPGRQTMSREEALRLLEQMKDKPVRRDRAPAGGARYREKNW